MNMPFQSTAVLVGSRLRYLFWNVANAVSRSMFCALANMACTGLGFQSAVSVVSGLSGSGSVLIWYSSSGSLSGSVSDSIVVMVCSSDSCTGSSSLVVSTLGAGLTGFGFLGFRFLRSGFLSADSVRSTFSLSGIGVCGLEGVDRLLMVSLINVLISVPAFLI